MSVVQVPDELRREIDRQVAEGRVASEAAFILKAVLHYADTLERHENAIVVAADEGIADIEAGRFTLISGAEDMRRLRAELRTERRKFEEDAGSAGH